MPAAIEQLRRVLPFGLTGRITRVVGLTIEARGFPAPVGAACRVHCDHGHFIDAEVVGFRGSESILLPHGRLQGIKPGNAVTLVSSTQSVRVGERLLGRVIDGRGRCIDGRPAPAVPHRRRLLANAPSPLDRPRIDAPLGTGIRAIDGFLTCGLGQRLGIFSGSGVGKSTLLGQMARSSSADVNVVILVGERGREVREFLERDLGREGLARSVVVVATSDEPAVVRLRAAYAGTAIAEYFRDAGNNVLLLMDSVTRVVLAQREIGLASGEPPATRGFPPSAFAFLPGLLERSGRNEHGSITGFYSVLVEADDANEPISDTVRGILDGHFVLSRQLAERAHWPAVDVLASISRSMVDVVTDEHLHAAHSLRQSLAAYRDAEDLINIGAYQSGSDRRVDVAIRMREPLERFLQQSARETGTLGAAVDELHRLAQTQSELESAPAPGTPALTE
ncbi:MAG: FliI/YscN family ATPase [Planctomycetaceae bacterium]